MLRIRPITGALALAFGGLSCVAFIGSVKAQGSQQLERVEVTGSAIKRLEGESALPITTITRQEIDQMGVTNAAQLVDRLVANNGQGYDIALALGDGARPGFSGASLRGLGPNSTLVLLNGRRMAVYAFDGGAVNLQQIPFAAIERVEVLRDGASSIYGTDAVAGVINFITRKDYSGLQVQAGAQFPTENGGEQYTANILAGFGNLETDRFNIFGVLSYTDQKSIKAADRQFSKTALRRDISIDPDVLGFPYVQRTSSNAFPGNILTANGFVSPYAPAFAGAVPGVTTDPYNGIFPSAGCQIPASYDLTSTGRRCRYDYASQIDIVPDNEVWSLLGRGTFQIDQDNQAFAELSWARQKGTFRISQTPASQATTKQQPNGDYLPLLYPAGGPYYPGNGKVPAIPGVALEGDLDLYYRTLELGPRTNQVTTDEYRILVGASGLVAGWDYNTGVYYTESKATENYQGGYVLESKLLPAMYSGQINPFANNTGEGLSLLQSTQITGDVRSSTLKQWTVDGVASREIMKLPAGGLLLAVGAQYYNQKYDDNPSPILGSSDIIGGAGEQPVVSGSRDVYAFFGELSAPIIKTLDAQLALRYDHYSDFGGNWSPKAGLRWQPSNMILVRGSYGQGFRAPTIPDLVSAPARTNSGGSYNDPFYDAQVGCDNVFDPLYCGAQLSVTNSGNASLQPEKSEQWSLGFVFEPTREFSVSADFWWINQKDLLFFPDGDVIIQDCINGFDAASLTCSGGLSSLARTRNTVIPGYGNVKVWNTAYNQIQNFADQNTNGVDVEAKWRIPAADLGNLTFGYQGTYILSQEQRVTFIPGQDWDSTDGTFALNGPVVRYKHLLTGSWQSGPWIVTLSNNYQSGYEDQYTDAEGNIVNVSPWSTWDLFVRWSGVKNLVLTAGINNLANREPPVTNQQQYFQIGYDPTYVNPRGRTPYLTVQYKFF